MFPSFDPITVLYDTYIKEVKNSNTERYNSKNYLKSLSRLAFNYCNAYSSQQQKIKEADREIFRS